MSPEPWIELRSQITTDLKLAVPLSAQNHSLLKQILVRTLKFVICWLLEAQLLSIYSGVEFKIQNVQL